MVDGERRPSTDTPTHLALYRALEHVGGVVHTHSTWATAWAQAEREIPVLGTTHADLMTEPVPVTRALTAEEIESDYEGETGAVLIETVAGREAATVEIAATLEEVARLALLSTLLDPELGPLDEALRAKHFERKHGPRSYYGQP